MFRFLSLVAFVVAEMAHAQTFTLGSVVVAVPEGGTATHTLLRAPEQNLQFLPPPGWKLAIDTNASQFTWTSPDYCSALRLKLITNGPAFTTPPEAEPFRERIQQEWREVCIKDEFPCYASGGKGMTFDFEHALSGKFRGSTRAAFVPLRHGAAEITLTSPPDQFTERRRDLSNFLNSFEVKAD
jgi:hypothetical protein